jgi:hypothetical protein
LFPVQPVPPESALSFAQEVSLTVRRSVAFVSVT